MKGGRPLRFLGTTIAVWTMLRAFALWPSAVPLREAARHLALGRAAAAAATPIPATTLPRMTIEAAPHQRVAGVATLSIHPAPTTMPPPSGPPPGPTFPAGGPPARAAATPALPPPFIPAPLADPPRRFAGSVWLIARGGANDALLGGQLGASQAGMRVTYTLDRDHRIAIAARLATPLHGRGREVALGIDWQPIPAPLHVVAERRVFLDGKGGGPSISVIGGIGPKALSAGLVFEAYGQVGGIAHDRVDGFADGLARVSHQIARLRTARLEVGAGVWGGAQRGTSRFDIGPSVAMALPVAGRAIRIAADWRERVAGNARPGSGPALSIGSDF